MVEDDQDEDDGIDMCKACYCCFRRGPAVCPSCGAEIQSKGGHEWLRKRQGASTGTSGARCAVQTRGRCNGATCS